MMFSLPVDIFIKTAAVASGVLFLMLLIQLAFERVFKFYTLIPEELREDRGRIWLGFLFTIEIILYAVAPTFFYFWIYAIVPFFSYRAGIAVAMFLYFFGTLPFAIGLALRMKLPAGVLTFSFFFNLLKLTACWATITWMLNS
jgi:hypothetical protein